MATARVDRLPRMSASSRAASLSAFGALLLRDVAVVRKNFGAFLLRTVMQPLLVVFVFAYVFPKIGQGIGGSGAAEAQFSTLLAPGMIAVAVIFQGIQAVSIPMVQEFGYTREIEDRVMAPLPVWGVGMEKIVGGALQGVLAGIVVFPFVLWVPATPVHLDINWFELVSIGILGCLMGASLGLTIGTRVEARQIPLVFSVIVLPMTMLGCAYYPWSSLSAIPWLQKAVLLNPLVYLSEGLRMAMTNLPTMSASAIYSATISCTVALAWLGLDGFRRRVLT